jgi:hypothetical protein
MAESDRGGAPTGVEVMDRCGWEGESHAATDQMALPAQLGQRSRLVNSTSQSRQHHASESRIGPWTSVASDSIGSSMVDPPSARDIVGLRGSPRVAAFILGDISIARLGGNFESLILQDEIDRGDLIFSLDRVVGNMINRDDMK